MNRLHVVAEIQSLVLSGLTEVGEINRRLRPMNPDGCGMKRTEVEKFTKQSIEMVGAAYFPVERRRFELDITEARLRADILDALATLDISDPNVAREVFEVHSRVGGSSGKPTLDEAIELLDEAGAAFKPRMLELWPLQPDDAP